MTYDHFNPPEPDAIVRHFQTPQGEKIDARKLKDGLKEVVGKVVSPGVINTTIRLVDGSQLTVDNRLLRDAHEDENDMWEGKREWI